MPDDITLTPANPAWPRLFEEEKARLLAAFGSRFTTIEHFGSTAVPGLDAKPIIDLLGGVASMAEADALLEPLCAVGWDTSPEFNASLPTGVFCSAGPKGFARITCTWSSMGVRRGASDSSSATASAPIRNF